MIDSLNKTIVNDTFNRAYNEEQFKLFIKDLLIDSNFEKAHNIMLPNDYKDFIKSARRICKYKYTSEEYVDEKVIDVLVVKLKKTSSVERARVAQRNFVARYLNGSRDYQKDAALVAFISEDENENIAPDWRFSFVQMNYKTEIVEGANGKKKRVTSVELTPAKRFSFLVGENEDTHTAQKQLATCLEKSSKGEKITIEDLVQAFDIEKVSKEFFDKYKALYLKLRDELTRLCNEDKIVNKDFVEHNINIDDFAKKTLGQLVFLYFIQKKGWLGVQKDKDWGTGDKKFLRNVFDKKYCQYENFFNDILEHLFYEALATDRGQSAWFDKLNCRIPFLNGGLFEPVNGYEYQKTDLTINNSVFKEIFETFDLYNFTVKEDEPLEKEVAIDPEMLGKVFENLLPENERKGNGAFYTPREIVHYMCQESLINYLYNKINIKEVPLTEEEKNQQLSLLKTKKEKEQLKLTHEVIEEVISKEDIEFLVKTGNSTYINKTRGINVTLPDTIKNNASLIDKALSDIKVCDPAIGSGAFPVGMMNEIVRARATLSEFLKPDRPIYELKRNVIENSIYGVDIDPGAVDIAKLRFWLSLVVDEEDVKNIKPLPNLDYKIMQGNSLITSFEGIDFDEIVAKQEKVKQLGLFSSASERITDKISSKQNEFLNTPYPTKKAELKQEIENLIVELVKAKFEEKAEKEGKSKDFYEEQIRNFAQNREKRNFFPWKLFFADVFDKGGFDVVIGNPPYVGEKGHKELFTPIQKSFLGEFYIGKMDLFYFFFHLALNILKYNGISSFITTNYFVTADGAKKLRTDLKRRSSLLTLLNFNEIKIFESALGQHNLITLFSKKYNELNLCNIINVNRKGTLDDSFHNIVNGSDNDTCYNKFKQNELYDGVDNYIRIFKKEDNSTLSIILNKIACNNKLLGTIADINSGADVTISRITKKHLSKFSGNFEYNSGVFVLSESEIDSLNLNDNEKVILKNYIKNSNIFKYGTTLSEDKLIYLKWEDNIELYPNIKKHLSRFINILKDQVVRYEENYPWWALHRPREQAIFDSPEKIIVPYRTKSNIFGYYNKPLYSSRDVFFITNIEKSYDLKYVLSILNSKLYYIWLYNKGKRKGDTLELYYTPLSEIPIKEIDLSKQELFISIVNKILELTSTNDYSANYQKQQAVKEYENQIDIMVYKLYDLTYQEVLIIDPGFSNQMSEEEYERFEI